MTKQVINIGQSANDKSGDPLRTAFNKINYNFTELYSGIENIIPDQTGNASKFLTTDGAGTLSWAVSLGGGGSQVNADWNAISGVARILNKPTIPTSFSSLVNSNSTVSLSSAGIITLPHSSYLESTDTNLKVGAQGTVTIRSNAASNLTVKTWEFGINGDLTLANFIRFWDGSVQETAYRYSASATAPTMTTGALWFNTDEGKLYVNYNNTWVDANPTEIDPLALRLNTDQDLELPGKLIFADNLIVADGIIGKSDSDTLTQETPGGTISQTTTVESQIEIGNNSIVIAKRTIQMVDDGIAVATDETGYELRVDNTQAAMKYYVEPSGPNNSAYIRVSASNDGAVLEGVVQDLEGETYGRITATTGPIVISNKTTTGTAKEWVFDLGGSLSVPGTGSFPVTFTATFDGEHYHGGALPFRGLTGDYWTTEVTISLYSGQIIVTIVPVPNVDNPGYVNTDWFAFTEADHGIPGYTLSITFTSVFTDPIQIAVNPPQSYAATIKSPRAISLQSLNNVWQFGTDGTLRLPVGGSISNRSDFGIESAIDDFASGVYFNGAQSGGTAIMYASNNAMIRAANNGTIKDWTFGSDGTLTLPSQAATLQSVDQITTAKIYRATNSNDAEAILAAKNAWIGNEALWEVVRDEDAGAIAPETRPWAGMPSWEAYPLLMNYENPPMVLPPASNMPPTAASARDSYLAYKELESNIDIVSGNKTFSFENTGNLTLPGNIGSKQAAGLNVSADYDVRIKPGQTFSDEMSWTFTSDGRLLLGADVGVIYANQTSGQITIGDLLGAGGIPAMPSSVVHIGGDEAFVISRGNGVNNPGWVFGDDGRTRFPTATAPATNYGAEGDVAGMVAFDTDYIYYCTASYTDGQASIWKRVELVADTWDNGPQTLTVNLAGTGTGNVVSSPAGISGSGSHDFNKDTVVTLQAAAAMGSVFIGWSGSGTSGTGQAQVTMDADKTVTATFDTI